MTEIEQHSAAEISATTFDEVSMERSKGFVKALQELKNLRPQLYAAAEYCEKSYLHSEQKQMVLDNVKDYAVRALVNAVDHLGTVAYKLTDLLDQHTLDISNMDLKVSCLDQKILTCRTYMNKEGLRQQQLLSFIPRHHKHYILPNSVSKKVHFSPRAKTDIKRNLFQARAQDEPGSNPSAQTLSWHLGSETKSTVKGAQAQQALTSLVTQENKAPGKTNVVFHLLDDEGGIQTKPPGHQRPHNVGHATNAVAHTFNIMHRDPLEGSKPLTAYRSFDNHNKREIVRAPVRSRSVLSAFFTKQKSSKLKAGYVS